MLKLSNIIIGLKFISHHEEEMNVNRSQALRQILSACLFAHLRTTYRSSDVYMQVQGHCKGRSLLPFLLVGARLYPGVQGDAVGPSQQQPSQQQSRQTKVDYRRPKHTMADQSILIF